MTDGFSCSVTGGFVYRGCRMSDLHGSYFYADFCSDEIRTFRSEPACAFNAAGEILRTADLATPGLTINSITSFGEDGRGAIEEDPRVGHDPVQRGGGLFTPGVHLRCAHLANGQRAESPGLFVLTAGCKRTKTRSIGRATAGRSHKKKKTRKKRVYA